MSFGKRGAGAQENQSFPTEARASPSAPAKAGIGAFDGIIAVTVALVAFVGVFAINGFFKRSAPPPGSQETAVNARFDSAPPPQARSYEKKGSIPFIVGGAWMMNVKMNETPEGFDAIDSELHERCMKSADPAAARYAEKRGRTLLRPERGADFLACSMRVYRSRFCEGRYRERLVERINEFVRARRAHIETVEEARVSKMGRMAMEISQAGKTERGEIASGYRPSDFVPRPLAEQIRALSDAGLISQQDFGGLFSETPEELKPYLNEKAGAAPCG